MPTPKLTRDELMERLLAVFRRHGFEGASLALISEETGLGKASLYNYFPGGKHDMGEAVLEFVGERFGALILEPITADASPSERLAGMILGVGEFYDGGNASCLLNVFSIGEAGERFRDILSTSLERWRAAIADVLVDAGQPKAQAAKRAEDAVVAVQGALVISRAGGSRAVFKRILAELPGRLLAD